jgi:hypothetical protein
LPSLSGPLPKVFSYLPVPVFTYLVKPPRFRLESRVFYLAVGPGAGGVGRTEDTPAGFARVRVFRQRGRTHRLQPFKLFAGGAVREHEFVQVKWHFLFLQEHHSHHTQQAMATLAGQGMHADCGD